MVFHALSPKHSPTKHGCTKATKSQEAEFSGVTSGQTNAAAGRNYRIGFETSRVERGKSPRKQKLSGGYSQNGTNAPLYYSGKNEFLLPGRKAALMGGH